MNKLNKKLIKKKNGKKKLQSRKQTVPESRYDAAEAAARSLSASMTEDELSRRKKLLCDLFAEPAYRPLKLRELMILLDVPREKKEELKAVLTLLVREGKAALDMRGKYGLPSPDSFTGIYHGNSRGFGFVTIEGFEEDVFIPAEDTGAALDGDEVRITVPGGAEALRSLEKAGTAGGGGGKNRVSGRITEVITHAHETLVGIYRRSKNYGFVMPDNQRIQTDVFIPAGCDMGAVDGHKVVVRISKYGNGQKSPEGMITEILGHVNDPGVDILSLARAYDLPEGFPEEVMDSLREIADTVPEEKKAGRLDLRDELMVTIDGEDAKDLDDAVSVSFDETTGLYRLGVHIADVSEYVREGSALDREAEKRGTSVYLVDRVIPMLPHKLSNGICSLNQGEDRLALSCIMWIDREGRIVDHKIAETLICVDRRMSYTNVNAIIEKNDARRKEQFARFVPMFFLMKKLSDLLRGRRKKRGGIDFDFPESKILLDKKGRVTKIEPYERNSAQLLIEDFMLAANETVAEDYYWQQLPFLYRVHEAPDPEKMRALSVFVENFGYYIRGGKTADSVHPRQLQELLAKVTGASEEALIARLTLRSMKQAKYDVSCSGHFGLAAKFYTHFTSPIRRYPDLQIHRIIKENLRHGLSDARISHYEKLLPGVAEESSRLERRADEAERECDKMKKCEYMRQFLGKTFEGVISGVTSFGFYVELPNTCEGLVHVNTLTDDYYVYYEGTMELKGERTLRSFKLGQPVSVQVTDADKVMRTIDFRLAPKEPSLVE